MGAFLYASGYVQHRLVDTTLTEALVFTSQMGLVGAVLGFQRNVHPKSAWLPRLRVSHHQLRVSHHLPLDG